MQRSCLVLPHQAADGPANMALDEALLEAVASGDDASYLRTYEWTVPTLSLGYFQRIDAVRAEPRWLGVPTVRRQTGGGAIWHHDEITYALVVPASHPLARPSTRLYRAVHAAVAHALAGLGIRTKRRGDEPDRADRNQKRSLLCFTEAHADDIVTDGVKIVGSAQRRRQGAVLQHGSILWARSGLVPELPGVCDVADVKVGSRAWALGLLEGIPNALGLDPVRTAIPAEIASQARTLELVRYSQAAWTMLR
jgi:lipoyl(octanoyl) transferase